MSDLVVLDDNGIISADDLHVPGTVSLDSVDRVELFAELIPHLRNPFFKAAYRTAVWHILPWHSITLYYIHSILTNEVDVHTSRKESGDIFPAFLGNVTLDPQSFDTERSSCAY